MLGEARAKEHQSIPIGYTIWRQKSMFYYRLMDAHPPKKKCPE
jgi:hypothetical protein